VICTIPQWPERRVALAMHTTDANQRPRHIFGMTIKRIIKTVDGSLTQITGSSSNARWR
jgi:hypothetical protein